MSENPGRTVESNYEEMQAEKGTQYIITIPRFRYRKASIRRYVISTTCLILLVLYASTPIGHLATPFFAMFVCRHPFTTFDVAETASIVTYFYQLLAKMGQFAPEIIKYPPHLDPAINITLAKSLGMAPQVIDLLQQLPYLDGYGGNEDEQWVYYGTFADFRDDSNLEQSRDPLFASPDQWSYYSENGPYMRPWHMALNQLGNHGAVLLLDTWTNRILVEDQECGCSMDPWLSQYDYEETWSKNRNTWEHLPSRHAPDVLRDFMSKFRKLEWLPGVSEWAFEYEAVKQLYITHGWPDTFNLTAFKVAKEHLDEDLDAQRRLEEPVQEVNRLNDYITSLERSVLQTKIERLDVESGRSNQMQPGPDSGSQELSRLGEALKALEQDIAAARNDLRLAEEKMKATSLSKGNSVT